MSRTRKNAVSRAFPPGILALGAALLIAPHPAVAQDDAIPRRLERKVNVMEKVLNEVLRESPYWLVGGGSDYTRSVYLEEFGVVFSFDASLVNSDLNGLDINFDGLSFLKDLKDIRIEHDGDKVIVYRDSNKDGKKDGEDEDGLTFEQLRDKRREREADRYEKGKNELVEALIDYGDTLTELRDDQFVAITAFLENIDILEEDNISHLIIKAKVSDLRMLSDSKITRDELLKRLSVKEY
jgi:hypothetical protein